MTKLLSKLTLAVLAFVVISCKKTVHNDGNGNNGPDYTDIPAAAPVSSKLMVYAIANNQSANPYDIQATATDLNFNVYYRGFSSNGVVPLDEYNSIILIMPTSTASYEGYRPYKTFTATSATTNYVNAKLLSLVNAGSVQYDYGSGTLSLPNNGQLVLPSYSFGMHSGSVSFSVHAAFSAPTLADYAVTLPCYPMADENGRRWFLDSYGMYMLIPNASDNSGYDIDFSSDADVILRMRLPANVSNAPDSIPAWNINEKNVWQQNGFAVRAGNYYEKKITKKGYWNFAIPVNGVYTTLHLKSSTGIGLPNVRYIIKNGIAEVAEGRTDASGDGMVFVPSNKDLTIDLINDHPLGLGLNIEDLTFGKFNKASEATITLPARQDIMTLRGSVFDCDGQALANGYAGIETISTNDEYMFPISDGKFAAVQWIHPGSFVPATLTTYNNSGGSIFSEPININSPSAGVNYMYNYDARFYTCTNSTELYCDYRKDNNSYSIEGNTAADSPELYSNTTGLYETRINLSDNGKGVRFNVWFTTDNLSTYIYPGGITVDDVAVEMDLSPGQSEIFLYRNDVTAGGIREGWFNIYYKDSNGAKHNVTGNFRIKIN